MLNAKQKKTVSHNLNCLSTAKNGGDEVLLSILIGSDPSKYAGSKRSSKFTGSKGSSLPIVKKTAGNSWDQTVCKGAMYKIELPAFDPRLPHRPAVIPVITVQLTKKKKKKMTQGWVVNGESPR
jgi:hypothetical protein